MILQIFGVSVRICYDTVCTHSHSSRKTTGEQQCHHRPPANQKHCLQAVNRESLMANLVMIDSSERAEITN